MTTATTATTEAGTQPLTGAGAPALAVQRLSKIFKDFWMRDRARAVDDITFHIDRGEIFGLLGPNGSGKSTTIKIVLGLLKPTKGRAVILGRAPTDVAVKKRIGYLPEESYLYGFLTAEETLDYYGKLFELDRTTRTNRIGQLLEMVGLTHARHRQVREFSKGMQRRIGLAQALINDPDLLILDEPTTGLDPIGTRQVKDLIIELGRRGKTVLLSSHLLADVEDVVDRMVILYGGKVRGEGTCDELLTAAGRTTIEADELDEATLAEIDEVIRRRTGGEGSVRRVAKPRQKLEELFLDIVERAQQERAETSGAQNSGGTASFLKAEDDEDRGDALIDKLVAGEESTPTLDPGTAPMAVEGDDAAGTQPDTAAELIGDLVAASDGPEPSAEEPARPVSRGPAGQTPPAPADADDDLIQSLLGDEPSADEQPGGDRSGEDDPESQDRPNGDRDR